MLLEYSIVELVGLLAMAGPRQRHEGFYGIRDTIYHSVVLGTRTPTTVTPVQDRVHLHHVVVDEAPKTSHLVFTWSHPVVYLGMVTASHRSLSY